MNEATRERDTAPEISKAELAQYLETNIRPGVMPSTFRIVELEFERISQEYEDARQTLEQMMVFFRVSHRNVYEKLMELYSSLYLPQAAPAVRRENGHEVDTSRVRLKEEVAEVRAETEPGTQTVQEEARESIYSMPTMRPPGSKERAEMPTLSGEQITNDLLDQMKSDSGAEEFSVPGQEFIPPEEGEPSPEELPGHNAADGAEDDDFDQRVTLVNEPPPELVQLSSKGHDKAGKNVMTAEERADIVFFGEERLRAQDGFTEGDEQWFSDGEKLKDGPPENDD